MRRSWTQGMVGAALLVGWPGRPARAEEPVAARPAAQGAPAASGPETKAPTAKEWLAKLDGTTWALELVLVGDLTTRLQDEIAFQGQRVTSQMLSREGYPTTNISLRAMPDGTAVWETMMSKPGEGLVFLRGDLQGDTMQGMMSRQPEGGRASDYAFNATKTASAPPASAASERAPESAPAGATAPTAAQPTAGSGDGTTAAPEASGQPAAQAAPIASPEPTGPAIPPAEPAATTTEKPKKRRWF